MEITVDLSQLSPEVRSALIRKLQHEDKARYDMGLIEQRRLAQMHRNAPVGAFKKNLGPAEFVMSRDQWQRVMQKYGTKIMLDPEFVPWMQKKHEDMRVPQKATKIQVGYTGQQADGKVRIRHA